MNKKGFTLVEILAVIVIIGIVATIGMTAIQSSIGKSRDATVVDLAKSYVDSAKSMRAKGTLYYEPKNGEAVIIPYDKIDGEKIENADVTGYGEIFPTYCYLGIVNSSSNYYYYVTQVDDSYHFLNNVESNSLSEEKINVGSDTLAELRIKELKPPFTGFTVKYGNSDYSVKAVRAIFNATVSKTQSNNIKVTVFENNSVSGRITLYTEDGKKKVKLKITKSSNNTIPAKEYIFEDKTSGSASNYVGTWQNSTSLYNPMIIDIKEASDSKVVLDIKTGVKGNNNTITSTKTIFENVTTTDKTTLYGQFYTEVKYSSASTPVKGSLNDFDSFKRTGKFSSTNSNVVTYDGIKYELNSADFLYVIAARN